MNGKPGEHLDHWVRQSLDQLPNTPPPGTTFDAERLWSQLRPELQKSAVHQGRGWVWWAAVACLIGAVWGWFDTNQQEPERSRVSTHAKHPDAPMAISWEPQTTAGPERPEGLFIKKNYSSEPPSARNTERTVPIPTPVLAREIATQSAAYATEPLTGVSVDSTALIAAEKVAGTVVRATKRRFQVVHLNELQAEEEIRPTPHRTDRFVRLGMGGKGQQGPETAHPTITWPITNKSNQ